MVSIREDLTHENPPPAGSGIERTGMLDAFAHDTREDILVLAMFETRPWEYGERQLYQLQEKLNAYVSFILDGEMKESFPHLLGKPVRIELRTAHEPPQRAMDFLGRAHDQLALQQIELSVVLISEQQACCSGEQQAYSNGAQQTGCCGGNSGGGCCNEPESLSKEPSMKNAHQEPHGSCGCHTS